MKSLLWAVTALALALSFGVAEARGSGGHSKSIGRDHYVSGYTTKKGTYVAPHMSTNPNGTKNDNYSTKGNVNPYTGKAGTKPRDGE